MLQLFTVWSQRNMLTHLETLNINQRTVAVKKASDHKRIKNNIAEELKK